MRGPVPAAALLALLGSGACAATGRSDPCAGVGCSSRGFCVADQGVPYCACLRGFHPVALACLPNDPADPCAGVTCDGHGTCRAVAGDPACDCDPGYRHLATGDVSCVDADCDLSCVPGVVPDADTDGDDGAEARHDEGVDDDGDDGAEARHDEGAGDDGGGDETDDGGGEPDTGCDPDEIPCGGACCPGSGACISGACCPDPTWRVAFAGTFLRGLARDVDGTIYVTGKRGPTMQIADGDEVFVAALDACGGEPRQTAFLPEGAVRGQGNALAVSGAYLYVVGLQAPAVAAGDVAEGLGARLLKASLGVDWTMTLHGSDANDEVTDLALADDGTPWAVGVAGTTTIPPYAFHSAWVIKADPDSGEACGWDPFAPSGDTFDAGWGIAAAGGRLHVTGRRDAAGFLTSYAGSDCSSRAPCPCAPTAPVVTFAGPATAGTEGRAVVADGGEAGVFHVVGWSADSTGDYGGFVARVAGDTAALGPWWNPTPLVDTFVGAAAAAEGGALYVVGATNWDGGPASATARGVLARYDVEAVPAPAWSIEPREAGVCWDALVDDAGGVVVVCASTTASDVRRCLPGGSCP